MNIEQKKFNELNESFASLNDKFKEIVAKSKDIAKPDAPTTQDCMDAMYACMANVHQRISNMAENMYAYQDRHQQNHPYPLLTASHKENYLKATGMENDYEKPAKKWANAGIIAEVKSK